MKQTKAEAYDRVNVQSLSLHIYAAYRNYVLCWNLSVFSLCTFQRKSKIKPNFILSLTVETNHITTPKCV